MTLAQYLALRDLTIGEAAAELGVEHETVRRYLTGARRPRPAIMERIIAWSDGQVTADAFYTKSGATEMVERIEDTGATPSGAAGNCCAAGRLDRLSAERAAGPHHLHDTAAE